MAITSTQTIQRASVVNMAVGSYEDDAGTPAAATITLGFNPRYFVWENSTDRIKHEWYDDMPSGTTIKTVAAGTRTLDTADVGIAVSESLDGPAVTIAAAIILQNKKNRWMALG